MAVVMSSGNTSITGNVDATFTYTAGVKTINLLAATRNTTGTSTLGTVPANKKWSILSIALSADISGGSAEKSGRVELNSVIAAKISGYSTVNQSGLSKVIMWQYGLCPMLAAAETATLITDGTEVYAAAEISYVEDDA